MWCAAMNNWISLLAFTKERCRSAFFFLFLLALRWGTHRTTIGFVQNGNKSTLFVCHHTWGTVEAFPFSGKYWKMWAHERPFRHSLHSEKWASSGLVNNIDQSSHCLISACFKGVTTMLALYILITLKEEEFVALYWYTVFATYIVFAVVIRAVLTFLSTHNFCNASDIYIMSRY